MGSKVVLLACLASALFMMGLIWFVQVVHYPLFRRVDAGGFARYHADHSRLTTRVVLLPMVAELATAAILMARPTPGSGRVLAGIGLAAALLAWASTAWVQVPLHGRLASGFDPKWQAALVRTNWVRTFAWTLHAAIALAMVAKAMTP